MWNSSGGYRQILGAIGFLLAFALFRRHVDQSLALAGSLAFALLPVTWVYSAVPETWILHGDTAS